MANVTHEQGYASPASINRVFASTYTHIPTGKVYIQKAFPQGTDWKEDFEGLTPVDGLTIHYNGAGQLEVLGGAAPNLQEVLDVGSIGTIAGAVLIESTAESVYIKHNDGIEFTSEVGVTADGTNLFYEGSDEYLGLTLGADGAIFEDGGFGKGLQYSADYSYYYTLRSLVDKEYVDRYGNPPEYAEVSLSAQFWMGPGIGNTTLLPALPANQYYDVHKIEVNLIYATDAMNFPVQSKVTELFTVGLTGQFQEEIPLSFINAGSDQAIVIKFNDVTTEDKTLDAPYASRYNTNILGAPLLFLKDPAYAAGVNLSESTILFKIWYETKTLGTEL